MKIYDYSNIKKLFFMGDIHGEFATFFFQLKIERLRNALVIVLGDCGIGFNKPKYYEDLFIKENDYLRKNNIHILMLRGNHDDPTYFKEEKINLSNIKTLQDYSIVKTSQENILCVGGAISTDRTWRKNEEIKINKYRKNSSFYKKLYWENEAPYLNKEIVNFLQENNININILATHTTPHFNLDSLTTNHITNWSIVDESLIKDIEEERKVFDDLFSLLKDNNHHLKYWYHGHYHTDYEWYFEDGDMVFRGLRNTSKCYLHKPYIETSTFSIKEPVMYNPRTMGELTRILLEMDADRPNEPLVIDDELFEEE